MTKEKAKKYIKGRQLEIMCELELPQKKKWKERLSKEFSFLRYVENVLEFVDDECDDCPPDTIFKEYKGYILQQSGYNNHYMIFKDGKASVHCQCTEKLDQKGAEEAIDFYIDLAAGKYDKEKEQKNGRP